MAYRWPGNIRELKNVVERITLKASGQLVRPADLPSDTFAGVRLGGGSVAARTRL